MNEANTVARRRVTVTLLVGLTFLLGTMPSAVSSAGTLPKELAPLAFLLIVKGSFAMASPGKPDAFTPYLTWDMSRTKKSR